MSAAARQHATRSRRNSSSRLFLFYPLTNDAHQLANGTTDSFVTFDGQLPKLVVPFQSGRAPDAFFIVVRHAVVVIKRELGILARIDTNLFERLRSRGAGNICAQRHDGTRTNE